MLCYRLETYVWQIHGVTWHRKSLLFVGSFLCVSSGSRNHKFPGCSAVPCPVTRSMCNSLVQFTVPQGLMLGTTEGEGWGCFNMAGKWRWCMGNCPGGEYWKDLSQCCVIGLSASMWSSHCVCMSSVLLLSIAVSSVSLALSRVGSGSFVEG